MNNDFKKFANSNGVNSMELNDYQNHLTSMTPYIIEERRMNATSIDVFSRLMMDRTIFFGTDVNSQVCNIVNAQLLFLASTGDEDIKLYINSPGGSVYDGLSTVDTMNYVKPDVSTTVMGMAASMGFVLATSGEKGKRHALQHSRLMQHQPMGGLSPRTQASDFEISYNEMMAIKKDLYTIISEQTGQPYKKIEKDCDRDYWMTAKEAVEYGVIDNVIKR